MTQAQDKAATREHQTAASPPLIGAHNRTSFRLWGIRSICGRREYLRGLALTYLLAWIGVAYCYMAIALLAAGGFVIFGLLTGGSLSITLALFAIIIILPWSVLVDSLVFHLIRRLRSISLPSRATCLVTTGGMLFMLAPAGILDPSLNTIVRLPLWLFHPLVLASLTLWALPKTRTRG